MTTSAKCHLRRPTPLCLNDRIFQSALQRTTRLYNMGSEGTDITSVIDPKNIWMHQSQRTLATLLICPHRPIATGAGVGARTRAIQSTTRVAQNAAGGIGAIRDQEIVQHGL